MTVWALMVALLIAFVYIVPVGTSLPLSSLPPVPILIHRTSARNHQR